MAAEFATVKTVIDITAPIVKNLLDDANKRDKSQIERCVNYLRAAQYAADGLSREFEEIIQKARICDVHRMEQVESLRKRVHEYLELNILRPEMLKAVQGLHDCRTALQSRMDRILNLPWLKDIQQGAVADVVATTEELENFITWLGYEYPSGVGLELLVNLRDYLDRLAAQVVNVQPVTSLNEIIDDPTVIAAYRERQKLATRIERTMNLLLATF